MFDIAQIDRNLEYRFPCAIYKLICILYLYLSDNVDDDRHNNNIERRPNEASNMKKLLYNLKNSSHKYVVCDNTASIAYTD